MKLLSALVSVFLVFVGTASAEDTPALCAAQTVVIQQNNGYEDALRTYNTAVVNQSLMCIETAQSSCELNLDTEQSAIEQACTAADGMTYAPSLSVECDNSNTKVTTTWVQKYAFCIGLNCTNTDDVEAQANELLANATTTVNVFLNPNGIDCSAQVSSDATHMSFSRWLVAVGSLMSAAMFFL
jgi:hypothetical protein